ncbi:MAG: FecR domain-containing protein, partial [Spirochaetaceae bacterium]|nr:FecR domain-containing protein [Spirochaetaceae bacterium]
MTTRRKTVFLFVFTLVVCAASWAQEASAVYVEGDTSRKDTAGALRPLDFGDALRAGDSVITKKNGKAELELPNRSTITVRADTVFTLGEAELAGGAKQPVLTTSVGSTAFKLNSFTSSPPIIRSSSMVAGVRGTELEVFAGMDGSSLVVVTEGLVELSAQGQSVSLGVNEAVEVQAGQAPGEKYALLGGSLDFSAWNAAKMDEFLKDPVTGIQRVEKQRGKRRIPVDPGQRVRQQQVQFGLPAGRQGGIQNVDGRLLFAVNPKKRLVLQRLPLLHARPQVDRPPRRGGAALLQQRAQSAQQGLLLGLRGFLGLRQGDLHQILFHRVGHPERLRPGSQRLQEEGLVMRPQ